MKTQIDFRALTWLPCVGLLALALAACSSNDTPLAPSYGDPNIEAPAQKWEPPLVDDGKGEGGAAGEEEFDSRDGYNPDGPDGGKNPSSPDGSHNG